MRCLYINLDAADVRRSAVEAGFAAVAPPGWSLDRFPAIAAADVTVSGAISAAERACFLSHRDAIASTLEDDAPVFVLEDDVVFSRHVAQVVDHALEQPDWDVLFTDVAITGEASMARLARIRRQLVADSRCDYLDLRSFAFAGSTAYVVRGPAKRRLWEILAGVTSIDSPYDLVLRELVQRGLLQARVVFPFLTSISSQGDASQIDGDQRKVPDQVYNYFRRLMYVERDVDACRAAASAIARDIADEEARLVAVAIGGMQSPKFPMS